MTENERYLLKFLGFLLEYPDESWFLDLNRANKIASSQGEAAEGEAITNFITYAFNTPLIRLQEIYTSAFDLDPETSLHLTYHLVGDSEDRGKLLAELVQVYRREGYEANGRELPDFLPLMLEFLAESSKPQETALFCSCLGTVFPLAERLQKVQHPYAGILELAATLVRPLAESAPPP